jgi:hypothetical protein
MMRTRVSTLPDAWVGTLLEEIMHVAHEVLLGERQWTKQRSCYKRAPSPVVVQHQAYHRSAKGRGLCSFGWRRGQENLLWRNLSNMSLV